MKLNLKVRFKNKLFWLTFIPAIISFIYSVLECFDIVPSITQDWIMNVVNVLLTMLASIGVLNDPTTTGFSDSARAMTYDEPNQDK